MQSVLLCEGSSDFTLLQMFMRNAYGWEDCQDQKGIIRIPGQKSRKIKKATDILTIMATGGCSRIPMGLELVLDRIRNAGIPPFSEAYRKIAIVTDNDEENTISDTIELVKSVLNKKNVSVVNSFEAQRWIHCSINTSVGILFQFEILLLVIPFSHQGAIETFLLDAIGAHDLYDKAVIEKCKDFVQNADPEKRYLSKRGYRTKAEFAAYFCIRTPSEAYAERQSLMKTGIDWSDYTEIQKDFRLLSNL